MKIVNNTTSSIVVRWKIINDDNNAKITLIQLFPKDDDKQSDVKLPESVLEDTIYIHNGLLTQLVE